VSESGSGVARAILVLAAALLAAGVGLLAIVFLRPQGPELSSMEPQRARPGDTIVLRGRRFDGAAAANTVLVGDRAGRVLGATPGELKVEVPALEIEPGGERNVGVRVLVGRAASDELDLQLFREAPAGEAAATDVATEPVETAEAAAEPTPGPPVSQPAPVSPAPPAATPRPRPARATPAPAAPAPALAPGPPPVAPPPLLPPAQRRFVLERTAVESNKRASGGLDGFEAESVDLKRAPDVLGRVDFDVQPAQIKPGDRYTVNVYLINDGKKDIRLKDMFVATSVNGRLTSGPASPRTRDVPPKRKTVIASFSDTWKDTIATWAMDVTVTSDRGDVYKNQIVWR
jgi:hypothetical protein